jgi:hypothetical protein
MAKLWTTNVRMSGSQSRALIHVSEVIGGQRSNWHEFENKNVFIFLSSVYILHSLAHPRPSKHILVNP